MIPNGVDFKDISDIISLMEKTFDTIAVLSITTGILTRKMEDIYDVMDFFYPGIMTLGLAAMSGEAKKIILAQHPELAAVKIRSGEHFKDDLAEALRKLPYRITLTK